MFPANDRQPATRPGLDTRVGAGASQAAAHPQYDEAIELEPSNRSSLLGRCIAFRHLHDYEHAMRNCEEAIWPRTVRQPYREAPRHAVAES